ncbi:T9SS type A sorting domain-containing protein [Hymenobacter busanensis]|uniref:T9SS type A sorting domain-containing protein n=1 Tax=Hymenobacter busanensis TaxID=2607656 RepID=A0A7L5A171_9BACT|nr:T9SS type A sorting domain-containing protein [Hymenobacter busanensis]KAA9333153.1 T9SS type A sorting domain-containing protein [Hymenobacter busanensis]QHJ08172.1 T9SS type A sorting domain-containing protein [Hymenobacter busanensis]
MKQLFLLVLFLLPLSLLAQSPHPNVLVSTQNRPNETAICINPKNTNELVAGANLNNQYSSTDGGRTWTWRTLTSPYSVYGDPCVAVDTTGAFYYFHLSNPSGVFGPFPFIDRLLVQRTASAGAPFAYRSFFGLNPPKQQDKEWVNVDRRTNTLYATWSEFDTYGSLSARDSSRILFTKSVDQGLTWTAPRRISKQGGDAVDEDNTVEGAVPAAGPNNEVYCAWAGPQGIVFNRSLDAGATWLPRERLIVAQPGGWDFAVPGIYRANGLPITACDVSRGPHRGTIYVNWSDQRNGPSDTDVWLARSTDGGTTWSAPIRVNNDPPGRQQFFTWMTVDQATGHLWFVFYDRRNYTAAPADVRTDVYGARSTDGGLTFQNFRLSQSPFSPSETEFFGDYSNITAHNNVVRPVWTRMDGTQTSVWTALIDVNVLAGRKAQPLVEQIQVYPTPATSYLNVALQLPAPQVVSAELRNLDGRFVRTLAAPELLGAGARQLRLPVADVAAGAYVLTLQAGQQLEHRKVMVLH